MEMDISCLSHLKILQYLYPGNTIDTTNFVKVTKQFDS